MTTTEIKLEAAIFAVEDALAHHQAIYTNGVALAARAEMARLEFMNRIQGTSGDGSPLNIQKGWPEIENILGSDSVSRYLVAKGISDAVKASPEFIEADEILSPLVAKVRKLEVEVAAEKTAAGIVAAERREAIAEATAKALAEVEARFPSIEPATPSESAPLVRGVIKSRPQLATV